MLIINKYICGVQSYWTRNPQHQSTYKKDIKIFYNYLKKNYALNELEKLSSFGWLKSICLPYTQPEEKAKTIIKV